MQNKTNEELMAEVEELRAQLEEAQETLDAIRRGEVDGLIVSTPKGEQVYTITGAERPYRALIEDMREGAVMLSDDNTVLYCNSGFAKMMRRSTEKIVGAKIESMVCPTYVPALIELLTLSRAHMGAVAKEVTLQAREDVLVPTLMSVNSLQSDTLKNTFLVVTDLSEHMEEEVKRYTTELELAQIALSESEQRWATTLASIGDAVIATDKLGKIKFMNGVAEELTGWTLKEASKRPVQEIFKIVNEFSRKIVDDPVSKVLKTGIVCGLANHTILIRKDKSEVAIDDSGAPIRDKNGKTTGVVLIFRNISERRKAEEALRDAEKLLSAVTNGSSDAIYVKDHQSRWLFANPALEKIVGKPSSEVLGRTDVEIYGSNEASKMILENDRRIMDSGKSETVEESVQYPDGPHSFISVKAPRFDEKGIVIGLVGISHDITERKKAEEKLRESEERFSEAFHANAAAAIISRWSDGKYVDVNDVFLRTFGFKREEVIGRTSPELGLYLSPEDRQKMLKSIDANKAENIEMTFKAKNGNLVKTIVSTRKIIVTGDVHIVTTMVDITDRKKAEEKLKINQKRFELLSDITSTLLSNSKPQNVLYDICLQVMRFLDCDVFFNFLVDEHKEMLHLNAYFGVPVETAKTFKWLSFGEAVCGCAAQAGERIVCENIPDSQDQRTALVNSFGVKAYCANPIFSDGKVVGTLSFGNKKKQFFSEEELSIMKSVTAQVSIAMARNKAEEKLKERTKQLELTQNKLEENAVQLKDYANQMEQLANERARQLQEKERLATIGATAGMVGHDIRNPLQAITSDVYLAKTEVENLPDSEEKRCIRESLEETEKNIEYINKIVQDLQDYARPLNPNAGEADLKLIIDKLLKKNGLPGNVNVSVEIEDEARKFVADSDYLNRIFYNLVTNAVQAMPQGGKLTIKACKDKKDIVISVKDTGIGIPKKIQDKMFTPMFTTKAKGQGFGLPVVKRMTESLGGKVYFESEEGKGTTFTIHLPVKCQ